MKTIIKNFDELTKDELYEILYVRTEVFVVEQRCAYQEVDGIDKKACHVFINEEGKISAYLRIYEQNGELHIGRVLTTKRKSGFGMLLMKNAISFIKERYPYSEVIIEAQMHAKSFYEQFGFIAYGEEFIIDDINHTRMRLVLSEDE